MAAWLVIPCFLLQIYFDFSGYSDMAIGLALMFGFRFPENFHYPLTARSVADFWNRWHMSLTNWFRSYVFFPVQAGRRGWSEDLKVLGIFFLMGLWHGANWNFVLFGLWNGLAFVLERRLWRGAGPPAWIGRFYLLFVMLVGLTLFRSTHLGQAINWLGAFFQRAPASPLSYSPYFFIDRHLVLVLLAAVVGATPWLHKMNERWLRKLPGYTILRAAFLATLFFLCAARISASTYRTFLYFQF